MELGATLCRASAPACHACPVSRWCASAGRGGGVGARVSVAPHGGTTPRLATPDRGIPPRRSAPGGLAFEHTTRWLRGRIVAQLRALEDGAWVRLPDAIGAHGPDQIAAATAALQLDGLLELRADGSVRLPSFAP
jgi:hypothetical protein